MAHLGVPYPVHFRRDFNINVLTFRNGLARGYHVKLPAHVCAHHATPFDNWAVDVFTVDFFPRSFIRWVGNGPDYNAQPSTIVLRIDVFGDPAGAYTRFQIDDASQNVLNVQWGTDGRSHSDFYPSTDNALLGYNTPYWPEQPTGYIPTITTVPY